MSKEKRRKSQTRSARIAKAFVSAAKELHARQLWRRFSNDQVVRFHIPWEPHAVLGSIMGQGGQEYGLALYRGPLALRNLRWLAEPPDVGRGPPEELDMLGFSMDPLRRIDMQFRQVLNDAGVSAHRDELMPCALVLRPGHHARAPRLSDLETLLACTRALLRAHDAGELRTGRLTRGEALLTLTLSSDPLDPDVQVSKEEVASAASAGELPVLDIAMPADLPLLDARWVIACPELPVGPVGDDERTTRIAMILDERDAGRILASVGFGDDWESICQSVLQAFEGDEESGRPPGAPREAIVVGDALFRRLGPLLTKAGVACSSQPSHPMIESLQEHLEEGFEGIESASENERLSDPHHLPGPHDLESWKHVERALIGRMVKTVQDSRRQNERAYRRYFGFAEGAEELLDELHDRLIGLAFVEWLFASYRPTQRSKTLLEKALESACSPAARALLESRRDAPVVLARVAECRDADGTLHVVDVLTGERSVVHDRLLCESARPDLILVLRLLRVGDMTFCALAGPAIGPMHCEPMLDHLENAGLELTPEGLAAQPHLLGRTWPWYRDEVLSAPPPRLVNTEGHELLWHTVEYSVEDGSALRHVLRTRRDLEADGADEGREVFRWIDEERKVSLAKLEIIGDELLVELNSAERLSRLRSWLDPIRGLTYRGHEAKPLGSDPRVPKVSVPLDDTLGSAQDALESGPMPIELRDALREHLRQHYLCWLDEKIPALGQRTPRQTCATPEGRRRIAAMIRAMPRPMPIEQGDVDVPREEMLRELGLERGA